MTILSNTEVTAWLNDPSAIRGTLVEVGVLASGDSIDTIRYLSTFSYTTSNTDLPSNTAYEAVIVGGLRYTEKLDITGGNSSSLSVGDIELKNSNGEFDTWLKDIWVNRPVKAYIGDPRWPRDSFILIFDGIITDIDSRSRDSLNLKIRDKLQRINTAISELKYSDIAPYPDGTNVTSIHNPLDPNDTIPDLDLPVVFGEVHNITPVLIDAGNLVYMVHYGPIKGIIEIRDNGIPLNPSSYIVNYTKGTFRMLFQPAGTLTTSVQGDALSQSWDSFATGVTYRHTVGSIIRRLVTGFGKTLADGTTGKPTTTPSPDRFIDGTDIDSANFATFETANPQPVGTYSVSKDNLLSTCQSLASSVGAQLSMSRLGKLRLVTLSAPPLGTPTIITEDQIILRSLQISNKTEVQGSVKLGFTKNWTVQTGLLTNIPYTHKQLFAQEYSTLIVTDPIIVNKYKLTGYPDQQDTLHITQQGANAEATRRLNMYKVNRLTYKFTGLAPLLDLKIGDTVQLVNRRFGLTGGTGIGVGTVVSLQPDWSTAKVQVEVLV